jgi:2-polyprenyl-3-methyl-5-hydroxy-6-metoxy-1,4-benzoquinol methylase
MAKQESVERFEFGKNWNRFLRTVDEEQVAGACIALERMLGKDRLNGRTFLDVGSGSGLSSLAARRLGATVTSFDCDPNSVSCTRELRQRFRAGDPAWSITEGSVVDKEFVESLGTFDIVYSWGVLHHTGNMRYAFENTSSFVKSGGILFIAVYNDQGQLSKFWLSAKKAYNQGLLARIALVLLYCPVVVARSCIRALSGRLRLDRGMSIWHDALDWLGGYPFEVAKPEEILDFFCQRGYVLENLKTCGRRSGCNEYVFRRG